MKRLSYKNKLELTKNKNTIQTLEPINDDNNLKIEYHVIHMKSSNDRKNNILKMENKLNQKINIFDAINGKDVININEYDSEIKCKFETEKQNEVGCYLSHYLLIKHLLNSNNDYTIIFEDDFNITVDDLHGIIINIILLLENNFDVVFLGTTDLIHFFYNTEINNIYKPKKHLFGTQALLINNKYINKIYNELKYFNNAIDNKYYELHKTNKLNIYVIHPSLVIQDKNFKSTIQN
jgi:GR25 family glycosyltransferase involved in LPS biosynthesis